MSFLLNFHGRLLLTIFHTNVAVNAEIEADQHDDSAECAGKGGQSHQMTAGSEQQENRSKLDV
jgi:hypothetical protein